MRLGDGHSETPKPDWVEQSHRPTHSLAVSLTYPNPIDILFNFHDRYASSLQALSHAMVIAPQNPFYVLQFAETAGTGGQWALALKMYLRVVEMVEDDDPSVGARGDGAARRAWFGVKLVSERVGFARLICSRRLPSGM